MEVAKFAMRPILSWIRRRIGARDPPLTIAALPMDMLYEILLHLPADEVCRLRLVCRSWRSLTSDPFFASVHAARHLHLSVIVVVHHDDEAAEVRAVDLHGNVIKSSPIGHPIGPLSIQGDKLCSSHGWGMTCVFNMVTGDIADVAAEPRKKVNSATPRCVLGHVPATGEYKVLRLQADYLRRRWRQTCDVVTLGGAGDDGRWRRRTPPPVTLSIKPESSSWIVAVVNGLAYFLVSRVVCWGWEDDELDMEADSLAVFDLATEEWKTAILLGPLTNIILDGTDVDDPTYPLWWDSVEPLTTRFQLARLGDRLVVVYCNVEDCSTELWFMEDMDDDMTPRWSRRYTLQCTPFALDETWEDKDETWEDNYFRDSASIKQYHYPLAVLDDGRILVWVDKTSALRTYDPETCAWTDLTTLTGGSVIGLHHGNLLC